MKTKALLLALAVANTAAGMDARLRSSTTYPVQVYVVLASDHVTPATGKTLTCVRSKNGGAFASCAGAVSELANGWYSIAGSAGDRDTLGELVYYVTCGTCDPAARALEIIAWDPMATNATPIAFASPVTVKRIEITRGDDYKAAIGTQLTFGPYTGWPSFTGGTAKLSIKTTPVLTVTCSVTSATSFDCDLTSAQTSTLPVGATPFDVQVTLSGGDKVTPQRGDAVVNLDVTP